MHSSLVRRLMEKNLLLVDDPLGNTVSLSRLMGSQAKNLPAGRLYDETCQLVQAPAFMIHNIKDKLYYFRSFGHNNTKLLEVVREENSWVADRCILNPGPAYLSPLLQGGKPVRVKS